MDEFADEADKADIEGRLTTFFWGLFGYLCAAIAFDEQLIVVTLEELVEACVVMVEQVFCL